MHTQSSNADEGNGIGPSGNSADSRAPYLAMAPLDDVMFEQLEYLLAHTSVDCAPECAECTRLAHIQKWLLLPFLRA